MWSATYNFFRDQGSILAGLLALIAGVLAYKAGLLQAAETKKAAAIQVAESRRRDDREVDALRKSLATEVRMLVARALGAHNSLKNLLARTTGGLITARMIESSARVPNAVVYPGSASQIGLIGGSDAMDVVIIYNIIEIAREAAAELIRSREPDNITPLNVAAVATAFLDCCKYVRGVLPNLKTGVALHDDKDNDLIVRINDTSAAWDEILRKWPKA